MKHNSVGKLYTNIIMSQIFSQLFAESFVRGVGKTSGALITMFVGWQMFKITNGHDDFLSFLLGKRPEKRSRSITLNSEPAELDKVDESSDSEHEEINLEDMENEIKFKSLFDKL
jgi:hypothetical protein